jgi:hypothetical protein
MKKILKNAEEQWWKSSKMFSQGFGKSKPHAKAQLVYKQLWQPNEVAAWAFELVRRLPNVDSNLTPEVAARLRSLQPYPNLDPAQINHLTFEVNQHLIRPLSVKTADPGERKGYSRPIEPFRFDLLASDNELSRHFIEWIEMERKLMRKRPEENPANSMLRARRDPNRLVNWHLVELLELQRGKGFPMINSEKKLRGDAKRIAKEFMPVVMKALQAAEIAVRAGPNFLSAINLTVPKLVPPKTISFAELGSVVAKAASALPKRRIVKKFSS